MHLDLATTRVLRVAFDESGNTLSDASGRLFGL